MSTNVENSIEFTSLEKYILKLNGVLPQSLLLLQEFCGDGVILEHLDGGGVEGGSAAIRGGDCQLGLGV